ncbi:curved DNA-binding protein CbpA [Elusimicrobium posterum]|uniref:DnaJ domain-containing protein n=1 Tax=Elusimicrobium posterum TaxID=3116653 RepID=UPI003C73F12F
MADYKDYYKILGVNKNSSEAEIKKAFKTAARKYHPDMHKEADKAKMTEKFKDVNEAYEVLSDKQKKSIYDQVGPNDYKSYASGARPNPGAGAYSGFGGARSGSGRSSGGQQYYYSNDMGGNSGFDFSGAGGFSDFFQSIFGGMGEWAVLQTLLRE